MDNLFAEFKAIAGKSNNIVDSVVAPLLFLMVNLVWGLDAAIWSALVLAIAVVLWRLLKKQDVQYAISGLLGTLLAIWLANRSDRAEDFFLPGIWAAAGTAAGAFISIGLKKPLVAFLSKAAHDWPLEWYWHPQVRPAYSLVTWLWAVWFAIKAGVQYAIYLSGDITVLTGVKIGMGWPATITLLIASYVLGRKRLQMLQGPSVEEFTSQVSAPWKGQQKGF